MNHGGEHCRPELPRLLPAGRDVRVDAATGQPVTTATVVAEIWRRRWFVLGLTLLLGAAGAASLLLIPKRYQAQVQLVPVVNKSSSSGFGSLGSAISQLGGIASLAGVSLPGGGSAKTEALATLQSEALVSRFIQDRKLLPALFEARWDESRQQWKSERDARKSTLWKGVDRFRRNILDVNENARTGLVTVTISWRDPVAASDWANTLVRLTNQVLRERAIAESEQHIAYLTEQAEKASAVSLRESIYSLLESEIEQQMLARGSDEFALKIIDPAVPPEESMFPKPALVIAASLCVGLLLGIGLIYLGLLISGRRLRSSE
jgi:uncharacterized protein involved in exopolysaccharide biosynthesis